MLRRQLIDLFNFSVRMVVTALRGVLIQVSDSVPEIEGMHDSGNFDRGAHGALLVEQDSSSHRWYAGCSVKGVGNEHPLCVRVDIFAVHHAVKGSTRSEGGTLCTLRYMYRLQQNGSPRVRLVRASCLDLISAVRTGLP